jgi:CPA2 family monovalent cation:H+ antiporter-2
MSHLPLLVNISVALAYALVGGLVARRLRLPTIVGYMLAGVAIGPVTPGFRGDPDAIRQFAEFGVILLMFGVGLHFSFRDLWAVRRGAVPGAAVQMAVIAGVGWLAARAWHFTPGGAWILGVALAVASTVVAIRALMDRGWLDSPAGKMAVGWLVFEDLATVIALVLLPALTTSGDASGWGPAAIAVAKAIAFVLVMGVVGSRVLPFLLMRIASTRSRELFVLMALTVAIGIALGASYVFGVSLALGAFVAGLVVSETPFSHQIAADLLPFREAFAVIFFVSVGMLVDPAVIASQWGRVLAVSAIIVAGKTMASAVAGAVLRLPARTSLVVAASRAQIGEFSFIVGQTGLALGLITDAQYSLILAGAIVSITVNPAVLGIVAPIERWLPRHPAIWRLVDGGAVDAAPPAAPLSDHVVIVGCGRVGRHIAETLARLNVPRIVIESDPTRLTKLRELGVPVLYGDAANSDILEHAALDRARALIITLPDDAAALTIVTTARKMAPGLHTISRASTWDGARRLREAGALEVVRPELEGGVEIVRRTLLELDLPGTDVQRYLDAVRREGLDEGARPTPERTRVLDDLVHAARQLEMQWVTLDGASAAAGRTIAETALRSRTGASIVAIGRGDALLPNPDATARLEAGDRIAMIGGSAQIAQALQVLTSSDTASSKT